MDFNAYAGTGQTPDAAADPGDLKDPFDRTMDLLNSQEFQRTHTFTFDGLVRRLKLMEKAGLPKMKVLKLSKLVELGRIPRSTDSQFVDLHDEVLRCGSYQGTGIPNACIVFFSHRWERPNWCEARGKDLMWGSEERSEARKAGDIVGFPDTADNVKAKALMEWAEWLKWKRGTNRFTPDGSLGFVSPTPEVLLFIDWCCVDQINPGPEIAALPAFVAVSTMLASYWTDEYETRAWCQAEMLMAYGFMQLGDYIFCIEKDFKNQEQKEWDTTFLKVPDPSKGVLTNEEERPIINKLTECATESKAFSWLQSFWQLRALSPWLFCMANVCCLCQCFGLCALSMTREVKPGTVSKRNKMQLMKPSPARVKRGLRPSDFDDVHRIVQPDPR
mmetsp:Transcript_67287/g.166155  ORF Transcript_67287/g.166155 Transcript_67287/m.166155 type:complete len:388 (-) Transcript_67287:149-1312(-)